MRLLFVHEVNYLRKVVYEIHDFPELLSLRGHEVTFVDFPEDEPRAGWRRLLDLRTSVRPGQHRAHAGASVEVRTPGRVLPPPLDRLLASATHVPVIARLLRRGRFDAVVLYGVPTNGWQTIRLARRAGVPVLFRAIDVSHELRPSIYTWLIRRAEHYIYRHADGVSANNVALRRYAIAAGARPERVSVEYPGLDLERFSPGPKPVGLMERYGLSASDRVVLFMGTFYRFAGLDVFLDCFAPVLRARPDVKLLLIGGGEADAELRAQVARLGLDASVVFTGFIDYPSLADHLRLGDLAINPFSEEVVTNYALPGKILQYAGSGLPTVCTRLEGIQGMVPEGEGITYRAAGPDFADAVVAWLDDPEARRAAGRLARQAMESRCQWDAATSAFEQAIERVVAGRP
jgi:glycosyltransferase involved in cell wall biosynthesis